MKKSYIILGSILFFVFVIFMAYRSSYNTAIGFQESVDQSWGNVQTTYQRRADLIPQLMETVKGAAANEKDILTNAGKVSIEVAKSLAESEFEKFQMIQDQVFESDFDRDILNKLTKKNL